MSDKPPTLNKMKYEAEKEKAITWIIGTGYYSGNFSELGKRTAVLFDRLWGLHHLNRTSLKKIDWANDYYIEFVYDRQMATVDGDDLTRLVILAHQLMLRVSVEGAAYRYLRLLVHQRKNRDGNLADRCPYIGDAIERLVQKYPAIDTLEDTP